MKLVVTDKEIGSCIQLELASFSMNFQFFTFLFTIGRTFVIFQVRGFRSIIFHMTFTFAVLN